MFEPSEPVTAEIVAAIRGGDRSAFDALFHRVGGAVYIYIRNRMGPRLRKIVDPEDVLQEVYAHAFERFASFEERGPGSMGKWLVAIARNRIRALYKHHFAYEKRSASRATRMSPTRLDRHAADATTPSAVVARAERIQGLSRAIQALPACDRKLILLYVYEGLPMETVAQRLNTPRTTLSSRLSRILAGIRSLV